MRPLRTGHPMPPSSTLAPPSSLAPPGALPLGAARAPQPSRRALLRGAAALGLAAPLGLRAAPRPLSGPRSPPASPPVAAGERRFLFLTCFGGWDPTRVLVPAFDDPGVDMEREAAPYTVGGLTFVDHPGRGRARATLRDFGAKMSLVQGLLVPSVAHEACLQLIRTGALSGAPDWPAILGDASQGAEPLPHVVVSGPSFPDTLSASVANVGAAGQLGALIDGSVLDWAGDPPAQPSLAVASREAALIAARRSAALSGAPSGRAALLAAHAEAARRADALATGSAGLSIGRPGAFFDSALSAVELLAAGLCRVASAAHPALWDSHAENDVYQNVLWDETIGVLGDVLRALSSRPGAAGGSLLDETVVVLMSEMGRTPRLNLDRGKDHWPYTSALLVGGGLAGGRSVGAYEAGLLGAPVGADGAPAAAGAVLSVADLGATLLALGDVDPAEWAPGGRDLSAALL